jgi:putative DNA primase/helicase
VARGATPGYGRSWRATANGLEGVAASATDTCLVLYEIGVGDARDVAAAVYSLANGVGKARASRDGSWREPRSWRVLLLSSGELPVESKLGEDRGRRTRAGQLVRLLDIPADRGLGFGAFNAAGVDSSASKLADAIKSASVNAYGTAGPEFVRRLLSAVFDQTVASARLKIDGFVQKFASAPVPEQIARAAKKFALIGVAGELATAFGVTPWAKGEAQRPRFGLSRTGSGGAVGPSRMSSDRRSSRSGSSSSNTAIRDLIAWRASGSHQRSATV